MSMASAELALLPKPLSVRQVGAAGDGFQLVFAVAVGRGVFARGLQAGRCIFRCGDEGACRQRGMADQRSGKGLLGLHGGNGQQGEKREQR